jgi:hypothetical protein
MAIDPQARYVQLGRLIESMPDHNAPLPPFRRSGRC